jgi:hypothetical protein
VGDADGFDDADPVGEPDEGTSRRGADRDDGGDGADGDVGTDSRSRARRNDTDADASADAETDAETDADAGTGDDPDEGARAAGADAGDDPAAQDAGNDEFRDRLRELPYATLKSAANRLEYPDDLNRATKADLVAFIGGKDPAELEAALNEED